MKGFLKVVNANIPTDIIEYTDFKVKAVKFRQQFAKRQGLRDMYVEKYDCSQAMSTLQKKEYHHFFIMTDDKKVGCLELKAEPSAIDGQIVGVLTTIYMEDGYRNYDLFKKVIYEIQEMYPMRIEAECWYEQPEAAYFKKFGFRNISARVTLT